MTLGQRLDRISQLFLFLNARTVQMPIRHKAAIVQAKVIIWYSASSKDHPHSLVLCFRILGYRHCPILLTLLRKAKHIVSL